MEVFYFGPKLGWLVSHYKGHHQPWGLVASINSIYCCDVSYVVQWEFMCAFAYTQKYIHLYHDACSHTLLTSISVFRKPELAAKAYYPLIGVSFIHADTVPIIIFLTLIKVFVQEWFTWKWIIQWLIVAYSLLGLELRLYWLITDSLNFYSYQNMWNQVQMGLINFKMECLQLLSKGTVVAIL